MITVTVCVGSSCHVKGARDVIERFSEFLSEHDLKDKVELKGAFCMERCGEGFNWQIDDEPLTSATCEEAVQTLRERVFDIPADMPTGEVGRPGEGNQP